jgi:hypothetical protein
MKGMGFPSAENMLTGAMEWIKLFLTKRTEQQWRSYISETSELLSIAANGFRKYHCHTAPRIITFHFKKILNTEDVKNKNKNNNYVRRMVERGTKEKKGKEKY